MSASIVESPCGQSRLPIVFAVSFALVQLLLCGPAFAELPLDPSCGQLHAPGQYGPYDFREQPDRVEIVLVNHFTPEVESLVQGKSTSVGGDIDYTLRALPNYHRALVAMMRLGEKENKDRVRPGVQTVECYFHRAIAFRPEDRIVRMIYSTYLNSKNRPDDAAAQLEAAAQFGSDDGFTQYNVGLLYFDMKAYDKALAQAHKALALGFSRTALQESLQRVGRWKDPEPAATEAAASAVPEAASAASR